MPYRFLLDTGADVSMVSVSMAEDLGIDLARCPADACSGIEGRPVRVYHASIAVRIGHVGLSLPCLISQTDMTPFLLGRAGLFARFSITFDTRWRRIVLTEIRSGSAPQDIGRAVGTSSTPRRREGVQSFVEENRRGGA